MASHGTAKMAMAGRWPAMAPPRRPFWNRVAHERVVGRVRARHQQRFGELQREARDLDVEELSRPRAERLDQRREAVDPAVGLEVQLVGALGLLVVGRLGRRLDDAQEEAQQRGEDGRLRVGGWWRAAAAGQSAGLRPLVVEDLHEALQRVLWQQRVEPARAEQPRGGA